MISLRLYPRERYLTLSSQHVQSIRCRSPQLCRMFEGWESSEAVPEEFLRLNRFSDSIMQSFAGRVLTRWRADL